MGKGQPRMRRSSEGVVGTRWDRDRGAYRGRGRRSLACSLSALLVISLSFLPSKLAAEAQEPAADAARKAGDSQALSARYRFEEKYVLTYDPAKPRSLS